MLLYEYQGKGLFSQQGITIPRSKLFLQGETIDCSHLHFPVYVKAQILTGGRGKAGAVKKAETVERAHELIHQFFSLKFTTLQSVGTALAVESVYVEESQDIAKSLYCALTIDRKIACPVLIASTAGGMDIEETAQTNPEKIMRIPLDIDTTIQAFVCRRFHYFLGCNPLSLLETTKFLHALWRVFREHDATLVEINPLVITTANTFVALDAKISTDDNSAFRHQSWKEYEKQNRPDPSEQQAASYGFSYIKLSGGTIGCMVNGAGLAMATMDAITVRGGKPANFLDVGGAATAESIAAAFRILMADTDVRVILINIFGGIVRCDLIAQGVLSACESVDLKLPLVVRLLGTHASEGLSILNASNRTIIVTSQFEEAVQNALALQGDIIHGNTH